MSFATDRDRWERTAQEAPRWDARNRIIAAVVPPGSSVVDLGAGAQTLREMLPDGCRYVPVDLVPGPGVIVCDFNAGEFPELATPADIAVGSGVLEYLSDPEWFLRRLPELAPRAVVSYAVWRTYQTPRGRRRAGWVSDLTRPALEEMLAAAGLGWREIAVWSGHLLLELTPAGSALEPALRTPPVDPAPADWAEGTAALRRFVASHGHAAGPPGPIEDGFDLHAWIGRQRAAWRAGRLAEPLARELESLTGWCWSSDELGWEERFASMRAAMASEPLPPELKQWLAFQRALAVEGRLHPERLQRLRDAGAL